MTARRPCGLATPLASRQALPAGIIWSTAAIATRCFLSSAAARSASAVTTPISTSSTNTTTAGFVTRGNRERLMATGNGIEEREHGLQEFWDRDRRRRHRARHMGHARPFDERAG